MILIYGVFITLQYAWMSHKTLHAEEINFALLALKHCWRHVFRAGHVTYSDHTTLDGGARRSAPLRLLDLESLCSGRLDQSDWLYQGRPNGLITWLLVNHLENLSRFGQSMILASKPKLFVWVLIFKAHLSWVKPYKVEATSQHDHSCWWGCWITY